MRKRPALFTWMRLPVLILQARLDGDVIQNFAIAKRPAIVEHGEGIRLILGRKTNLL